MSIPASAATLDSHTLTELRRSYRILDPAAVAEYLAQNRGTSTLLAEAAAHIRTVFPADTSLVLDLPPDYEGEGERDLFVRVQTQLDVDTALRRMDQFNEMWWQRASARAPHSLHFTTEYV